MADPFIGEIKLVPYNFAPRNWAFCQGQILSIAQNTALFSLLGTTYGGNGQTTFALPNLQGRVPISEGQGPGLSSYDQGQTGGEDRITLTINQLPAHNHGIRVSSSAATSVDPLATYPAVATGSVGNAYGSSESGTMHPNELQSVGGNQPHSNMQPYLVLNYIIALQGVFPPRN